jgi:HEPN domain-containing protein
LLYSGDEITELWDFESPRDKMNNHVRYWLDSAAHDLDVAESLFQNAKYDWCLFLAHLVLEKILKAC